MTDTAATDTRLEAAHAFIQRHAPGFGALRSASSDASNRRYWRAQGPNGESLVVMDSPPDKEPLASFLDVQSRLERNGLPVPHIHARDLEGGFLLLDDLGNDTLFCWQAGAERGVRENALAECRAQLITVAQVDRDGLPAFDAPRLSTEMQLFDDWYRAGHLGLDWADGQTGRWAEMRDRIASRLATMPPVFVHRDYHSRNLMRSDAGWAIIDFQDAVSGPLAYDLVSLLRDSYIDWPTDWVEHEIESFWQQAREAGLTGASLDEFIEDFAWVAVQRHLKVLGIFARLSRRDGKHGYLDDLPLTWRHLQWALDRAPQLAPLRELITGLEPENARG